MAKSKRLPSKNLVAIDGTLDALRSVSVRIREKGRNANPVELRMFSRDRVREHVECGNPYCHDGGFSLGDILRDLVRNRQHDFIGTSFCRGQEGDFEIPATLHSCETRFEVEASVTFR